MSEFLTDLQIGGHQIIQDSSSYCFSQDSIILANIAKFAKTDRIIDLGSGCGILSTLAILKQNIKEAYGIEIQEKVCDMSKRSNELNGIKNFNVINGDICDIKDLVPSEYFDKAICNPPYYIGDVVTDKNKSNLESSASLEDFIKAAFYALKFGGVFYIVMKVNRITSLLYYLRKYALEPKEITFVYPKEGKNIDIVIVKSKKGAQEGVITKNLYIKDKKDQYTKEFLELYK